MIVMISRAMKSHTNEHTVRGRPTLKDVKRFPASLKPRPNDRNMPTQHIATLLRATCCVRLAKVLRRVATCRNLSQQGGQTHITC